MSLLSELRHRLAARLDSTLSEAVPPPFLGEWKPIKEEESAAMLARLSVDLARSGTTDPRPLAHGTVALRGVAMPCYGRAVYVDAVVRDRLGAIGQAGFVVREGMVTALTTESTPIHTLNEAASIRIETAEEAVPYLRLFCWTVCGDLGPFQILERPDALPTGSPLREHPAISPIGVDAVRRSDPDDGSVRIQATVMYDATLFAASFLLSGDGCVEMTDDDLIAEIEPPPAPWRLSESVRYRRTGRMASAC